MKIEIDGKLYDEEYLNQQIEEAKYRHALKKDLKYGDKIWTLVIKKDEVSFSVTVIPGSWTGSSREFQLLEQCLIFRTESSALYAMKCLHDAMLKF